MTAASAIEPFEKFLQLYEFDKRLQYFVQDRTVEGSMSRIYIVHSKGDPTKLFICKRVTKRNYNKYEWTFPNSIPSQRVVKFLGVYHRPDKDLYYLISPYDPSYRDLYSYIYEVGKWSEKLAKLVFRELCLAVKDCHDSGLIHLDIKTENFIVRKWDLANGVIDVMLIDFGFARLATQTKMKESLGTRGYCAPEVEEDFMCSKASDMFSLGMVLMYILYPDALDMRDEDEKLSTIVDTFCRYRKFSSGAKELVRGLLRTNPTERMTIDQVLQSEWFNG